jgi:hypothetical protein
MRAVCSRRRWLADCGECRPVGRSLKPYGAALLQLALLHSAKRARGERVEARSRRSVDLPWKGKTPRELSGCPRLNPLRMALELAKGLKPGSRCPVHRLVAVSSCGKSCWANGKQVRRSSKDGSHLPRGASKGRIPGALPGRNKPGQALRGANRQEGNQTLKAERSGVGIPRGKWTLIAGTC